MFPVPGQRSALSIQEYETTGILASSLLRMAPPALPQTMQFVRIGDEACLQNRPPLYPAEFPEIVQLVRVGQEEL